MKIAVTALSLAIATRSALPQKEALFHKTGLDDVYFSNDIIFENGCVRSKLDCARQCASDECCVTFTYTKLYAGHGICRGHWTAVATGNVTTSLYRARTYVYQLHTTDQTVGADWHLANCKDSTDCPVDASGCSSGMCLCAVGYYYSEGSNSCLESCPACHLGSSMVRYPAGRLTSAPYRTMRAVTSDTCVQSCLAESTCRTIVFFVDSDSVPVCQLQNHTAMDVEGSWQWDTNYDAFQRTCA